MFRLTSLNLNGIRSATTKGLEPWLAAHAPDCMCVQEVKAQQADIVGKFEVLAAPDAATAQAVTDSILGAVEQIGAAL